MTPNGSITDRFGRPMRSLRLSVTDRCNLRCLYCMPEEDYVWLPREDLLTFEETAELAGVFAELGVEKLRLTGGEPLLRRDLPKLVQMLAADARFSDIAMTTNGVQLAEHAPALRAAGLHRLNVSLDTLRPERFQRITRRGDLPRVLAGLEAAARAGFRGTKIDAVILRGQNEDQIPELLEFGHRHGLEVRLLEYMDVGGATAWSAAQVMTRQEMLAGLERQYGRIEPLGGQGAAPAERFRLPDGTVFGIIASTSTPFCRACDRSRITADGMWFLCLYATRGINLRDPLRSGASRAQVKELIASAWRERDDRGAETRRQARHRDVFIPIERLRTDPHLEMHTRGG